MNAKIGLSIFFAMFLSVAAATELHVGPLKMDKIDPRLREIFRDNPERSLKVWVFFTDKETFDQTSFRGKVLSAMQSFSERARLRRQRRSLEPAGDYHDIPVSPSYIEILRQSGAEILRPSRWLNAVAVNATSTQIEQFAALPFVSEIKMVAAFRRKPLPEGTMLPRKEAADPDYGNSFTQLNMVNIPLMHHLGYTGEGVLIAIFDTGFELNHPSLASLNLIDKYDFINNDTSVGDRSNSPIEPQHGTYVLSVCGGYAPGFLVGAAFDADYLLAKTEKTYAEEISEEYNWIAAAEWADSLGADIISSSLGYVDWYENTDGTAIYSMLDGNTAPITIAADIAASRMIAVFNAAGNERDDPFFYISPPADADSIISVGAVNASGLIAGFSSSGPTYDGRRKPEIVALGVNATAANFNGGYTLASGTSLSTPIAAGAGALLLQIHPDWNPIQLRDALSRSADRYANPDYLYGYGLFDTFKASGLLQINPISSIRLQVRDTVSLTISAIGGGGEAIVFSASNLPSSAGFIDNGDGTASLTYVGRAEDIGSRTVQFVATAGINADTADVLFSVFERFLITAGPNPFTDTLTIFLGQLPQTSAKITIHTVSGEKVWEKISDNNSTPGEAIIWNGTNSEGKKVAPGMYIVIVAAGRTVEKIKVFKKI